jgi:ankyrin repeat protein
VRRLLRITRATSPLLFPPTLPRPACKRGVLSLCQILVDAKADVGKKNSAGQTPLHIACNNGQLSIVSYLLSKEADPNEADKGGNTALHIAAKVGFKTVVQALLAGGAKTSTNRAGKTPAQVANDADIAKMIEGGASS